MAAFTLVCLHDPPFPGDDPTSADTIPVLLGDTPTGMRSTSHSARPLDQPQDELEAGVAFC